MNLPFQRSYWVEPGRLLAGYYPGDSDPVEADYKLQALLDCGVSRIVNLMESDETDHSGRRFAAYQSRLQRLAQLRGRAVECVRFPIKDRSVPSLASMRKILEALVAAIGAGETVYVHCWGGRGRTGTVTGCYLRHALGVAGAETLARLRELTAHNPDAFWPAPEMEGQRAFVERWTSEA
jgi:protein tyrosine/serine phosphatase